MKCLIISGGKFTKAKLENKYDLIIACDKGHLYAKKLKLKPDIVVGDFDSSKMPHDSASVIAVPKEKDDTDTGLAIKYALANGYKEIDIICALGNRIDHTLANLSLLKFIAERAAKGRILADGVELFAVANGLIKVEKKANSYLSIFSLSDKSHISIKGTAYDVKDIVLKNSFPLGVSNEFKNKNAYIKVDSGIVLISIIKKVKKG